MTATRVIMRDGKNAWCGSTMLEMNFVRYAIFKYTNYKEYEYWEREAVPRAEAQGRGRRMQALWAMSAERMSTCWRVHRMKKNLR